MYKWLYIEIFFPLESFEKLLKTFIPTPNLLNQNALIQRLGMFVIIFLSSTGNSEVHSWLRITLDLKTPVR